MGAEGEEKSDELNDRQKKLHDEMKRYSELFNERVAKNLGMGPKANAKVLPKGTFSGSCGGCSLLEPRHKTYFHDLDSMGIRTTRVKCTHCETHSYPRASELELTDCWDFGESFKNAGGTSSQTDGGGKRAILEEINVENRGGHLYCRHKPHSPDVPEGGYKESCISCQMTASTKDKESYGGSKSTLKCEACMKADGTVAKPVVFRGAGKCTQNGGWVQNKNGKLSCTRDRPTPSLLSPSGISSWLAATSSSLDRWS